MPTVKRNEKGDPVFDVLMDPKVESDSTKKDTGAKSNSTKKNNKAKPVQVFVGFYRNEGNDLWGLHPQMLSSEESVIKKLDIMYGDVEMHVFATELPA